MSNATSSRLGLVNNTGTAYDALFLKVFSGEVLASFGRENKMLGMTTVRTISSGKSAQFPVTGTIASSYHTVGAEILGTAVLHNEKVINIDDMLLSHALDKLEPGVGLHGEKCGIGTIMIAKLQGQDWKKIIKTLKSVGAPTTAKEIGLKSKTIAKALTIAQSLRPERYTILKEVDMTEKKAITLAKNTRVL